MLRALVLSVSIMLLLAAAMVIFAAIILSDKKNLQTEMQIIEVENARVENEIN